MTEDNSHAGQGAVLLDVGGDVGAIVLSMPAGSEGLEIEIRPVGETHRAVFGTDGHDGEPGHGHLGDEARDLQQHSHGHDHSEHDHPGHDHSEHDHSEHDHSEHDHSEHDHSGHDHSQHEHPEHDHDHEDRPAGGATAAHVHPWPHVGVVARPVDGRRQPSAVFGEVVQGRYDLYLRPHGPVRLTVDVIGGEVTQAVWPG